MTHKILVLGSGAINALLLATLKEKHGEDIVILTPDEAKEQGLNMEDFANIPSTKIIAPPIMPMIEYEHKSGKEKRRERRKKERKSNKLKK